MSELKTGLRISVAPTVGAEQSERTRQEDNGASMGRSKERRTRGGRAIKTLASLSAALALAGCASKVSGEPLGVDAKASSAPESATQAQPQPEIFPCKKDGAPGKRSTDPNVRDYLGATTGSVASAFHIDVADLEWCGEPILPNGTSPADSITSVELRRVSTGDRMVFMIRQTTAVPNDNLDKVSAELKYLSARPSRVKGEGPFDGGKNEQRYAGVVTADFDPVNPANIGAYGVMVDRPIAHGSDALYEVYGGIYNNPQTHNDLARDFDPTYIPFGANGIMYDAVTSPYPLN